MWIPSCRIFAVLVMILGSISAISSSQFVLNFPPFCTSGWRSFSNLVPRALGCRRSFYWGSSGAHLGKGPPYFWPNWGPKGEKFFETDLPRPPPPPYLRVWMIFEGLDPVLLASFSFPIWLTVSGYEPSRTDLTNRDIQSTKLKLNLNLLLFPNTQFSLWPFSHRHAVNSTRENSFFTKLSK